MKKTFLLFSIIIFSFIRGFAQQTLTGKVLDAVSRQPLEAASIEVAGSNNKVLTDPYGNFLIRLTEASKLIQVSYIGYESTTIAIGSQKDLLIALKPGTVNMKDIVITQNSGQQKFSTLARVDLDVKPVKNTQELLRLVPGLFVSQHAGGGKAEQIFLRGFDCDHGTDIQVSVDGLPVNMVSHAHGQGYADAHFIIPETVNNVDYGTGPYYTQHGNLNTAGYVSFSTLNSIANSRVQVEAGRFSTFRGLVMLDLLKKNKDKQSAYIAGEANYTNGPTINKQHFNRFNVLGKYNLAISANTQLTALASGFKSKWDASGQVPERAVQSGLIDRFGSIDPSEGGNTERYNASINLLHRFTDGSTWENQAWYSFYKFNLYSNFTFYLKDPVNGDEIEQAEKRSLMGYLSKFTRQHLFQNWSLHSIYGAGVRHDATTDSRLSHVVKRKFLGDLTKGDVTETNAFAFMQQQASFGKFFMDGGVRFDYLHFNYLNKLSSTQVPGRSKAIISPKLNVQYTFTTQVQAYVKLGKGFHSNDSRVVVANDGKEILPAAYGADIGIIVKPTKNLLLNVAAWYLHLDQEFVYVGDEGIVEPSGKTRRQGIDVIARYQISSTLFANTNINFTKPRAIGEPKGENHIPLAPTFTSTGGIFYKKKWGWNGGLNYRFIKDRPANEDNSVVAKGYFILDGAINYSKQKFDVGLAIENIFNTKWNEAQFATESQLLHETAPVTELHYTPGLPFFIRAKLAVFF